MEDPSLDLRFRDVETFIQRQESKAARTTGEVASVIRIPVVVHVIYKSAVQNISEAQILSQIDVLNRDFRRKNADTLNTPARFKAYAADVQIEFALATSDPAGRPSTGIIRKQTNINIWSTDDKIKYSNKGGDDAWDSRYYLNIWIGNVPMLGGYSSRPGGAPEKDGIVIHYGAFGTLNNSAPFDRGRTAVHEVGHWLGLNHIWGDSYCGDDLVQDTPKQGNYTMGCPNGIKSSCSNGPSGDMYMNYMDYTNDACMNLFTKGQKDRMLALFNNGGPRYDLLSTRGLDASWNSTTPPENTLPETIAELKFFPNPVQNEVVLTFRDESWVGRNFSLIDVNGTFLKTIAVTSRIQKFDMSDLRPGMYFIQTEKGGVRVRIKLVKI